MKYEYPDKAELQNEYLAKFGQKFLELNGLSVGDEVVMEFPYEETRPKANRRGSDKFTFKKSARGILTIDDNGVLCAESLEEMTFCTYKWSGMGRSFKEWYELKRKKSVIKLGTGFIL